MSADMESCDAAELSPGTIRSGGATATYDAPDAQTMLEVLRAWTILAAGAMV